jgi:hypothetical protein
VIGGTDASVLVQLANSNARPADAVFIEEGWLQEDTATIVEELFASRSVPCVTMQGDLIRAREAIDRLLGVAV